MPPIIRVLLYLLAITAGALAATILAGIVTPRAWAASWAWLIKAMLVMTVVVAITHLYVRRAGIHWSEFGLVGATLLARAGAGCAWGLALGLAWSGAVYLLAPYQATWNPQLVATHWLAGSIGTVAMAVAEEVGYRSFALRELRRLWGYGAAVLIPTAIFATAHVAGGIPWQPAILVVGSTSVLLSVIMLETRSLPLVMALHAATNLVQDNLLRSSPDASLFVLVPGTGPTAADSLAVWLAMLSINAIAVAAVVIAARARRKPA